MRIILIFFFSIFFQQSSAQCADTIKLDGNLPVTNACVVKTISNCGKPTGTIFCSRDGVMVISKSDNATDSVYAIANSMVTMVTSISGSWLIILKCNDFFIAYNSLEKVVVKKGDRIIAGQYLGDFGEKDNGYLNLEFIMMSGKGKYFGVYETIKFLQTANKNYQKRP
ncbi:MAG: peptidoglycan DD-metalloendopeptidase family protein [Bacteroidota bacterium]